MLVGTETEYGIHAPGRPDADPHLLSALVVDACPVPATGVVEDTHNRTLANGARFYVDHGHPEYSGPECTGPTDALTWELAGDAITARAAAAASARLGSPIAVFKNNTDGKGSSYGYHENHLLRRDTPFERVVAHLPTFLATRIVYTGAGRVGLGPASERPGFQVAQRPDFFDRLTSLDTTRDRGIVNTRDEPHARPSAWRRLHVIAGDATRNPFATWLKIGTLGLFLAALEAGDLPGFALADPVAAFRATSHDPGLVVRLPLAGGGAATAVDVQRRLLDAVAASRAARAEPEADAILAAWSQVLDDLTLDPDRTADRLDWTAKRRLLGRLVDRLGTGWDDPRVSRLDLAWAELSDAGPFAALARAGGVRSLVAPEAVVAAVTTPPPDTRAWTRGSWIREHPDAVVAVTWDSLLVRDTRGGLHNLLMREPRGHTAAEWEAGVGLDRLVAQHESGGQR